jgi:hypothetical protein
MTTPPPDLSRFQDAHGQWLEYDLWPHAEYVTTCHGQGCPVAGVGFRTTVWENVDGQRRVVCGRCGGAVSDLQPTARP